MSMIQRNKTPLFISLCVGIFGFISIFGVWHIYGMGMQDDGTMGGCLFTGMEEICAMSLGEHISQWQNMFAVSAPQGVFIFVLLVLLAVIFVAVAVRKRNLFLLFRYYATHWRLYIGYNSNLSLYNPLREAFSQGILNPKIYDSVAL